MAADSPVTWTVREDPGGVLYTADRCRHGEQFVHTLDEALVCGILDDLRWLRGISRADIAVELDVHWNTVQRWTRGVIIPTGLYRKRLCEWIARQLGGA